MSGGAAVRSGAVRSVAEPSRPPPSRLVICGAVDEPPSRANAADSARLDRRERGGFAQLERVAARRHAEHASVLAPDRRGAVVADSEAGAGDVRWLGKEPCPRFVQADLLLEGIGVIEVAVTAIAPEGADRRSTLVALERIERVVNRLRAY
jgi:hypothetical protein